ncbi:hypothetical protein [Moritella sp. F3]|uniref:hypothetical protein n=1 Tax=Moritella sp. F3 TaxID=2718882 RepID=UPI0018E112E3|nr:hypothetical protein [Moritella sp. F3]GIC77930.1 hypothetical protein FMO001_26570 [Moritella sp. F1]GIC82381.1 hypothetical protein FMO003_26620 [Moritella sp. F3]
MKKQLLATAVTSALAITSTMNSANAGNVTDKVSLGAFMEVGGYIGGNTRQSIDAYHFNEESPDATYHSDTAGSIRVKYKDGQVFGGIEIDAYMDKDAKLDKSYIGYNFDNGVTVKGGLIDSVFDARSSYGDLAVEFGKGAVETGAGGDVNGATIEYGNARYYAGITVIQDDDKQTGSFNGAVDFKPMEGLLIGAGFLRTDGIFWGAVNDSYSWNVGTEYQATEKLKIGALYNQYRVNDKDESVDLNASSASFDRNSVDMDQWEISAQYKLVEKLTLAAQVSSRDYNYENSDYTVTKDGKDTIQNDTDTLSDSGMFYGFGAFYDYSKNTRFSADYQYGAALKESMGYIKAAFYF